MDKHKEKALEEDCLCTKCTFRFQCFTQERVFSDPILQGLFEALMAQGKSKEEALDEVTKEIKFRMNRPITPNYDYDTDAVPVPNVYPAPGTIAPGIVPWISDFDFGYCDDRVNCTINDVGGFDITYTMHTGEEISWKCK